MDQIVVETTVPAHVAEAWDAYTSPDRITKWHFASDDWHCPTASVDLREGRQFTSRMEAKDGSMGFDFAGTYTKIVENERIDYDIGGRRATVSFTPRGEHTHVRGTFDPGPAFPSTSSAVAGRPFSTISPNMSAPRPGTPSCFVPLCGEGWLYLAAVLDLDTRRIVGWSMRDHMRTELTQAALMMATQRQRPGAGLICHSDRGSQYAAEAYRFR